MDRKVETVFFQEGQGLDYISPPRNDTSYRLPIFSPLL